MLRQCLEMRKRKVESRQPHGLYGRYGGKPLWTMSRDIDRVIADNHPRLRRARRVEEAMKTSLQTGAILDEAAMSRRLQAFFQLKETRKRREKSPVKSPEPADVFAGRSVLRRRRDDGTRLPPLVREDPAVRRDSSDQAEESGDVAVDTGAQRRPSDAVGVAGAVSLDVDAKGRLRGIRTGRSPAGGDDVSRSEEKPATEEATRVKAKPGAKTEQKEKVSDRTARDVILEDPEVTAGKHGRDTTSKLPKAVRRKDSHSPQHSDLDDATRGPAGQKQQHQQQQHQQQQQREGQYRASDDQTGLTRSRSKLILPPIDATKAMVSRT